MWTVRTVLRNSMACGLAAIMTGILTVCHIADMTIDTIVRFFSRTGPDSNPALNQDNALI